MCILKFNCSKEATTTTVSGKAQLLDLKDVGEGFAVQPTAANINF